MLGLDPSARPFQLDDATEADTAAAALGLPEDAASLFSPLMQPLVGLGGNAAGGVGSQTQSFHSLR